MIKTLRGVQAVVVAAALVAVSACGGDAPAQGAGDHGVDESAPMALELTGVFPETFGLITNVREFDDGTLLVADPLSKVLLKLDMDAGTLDTIGSEGPGPDEYGQPDAVYALEGGRSFMVDLGNARYTEIEADLSFGQTYPLATGSPGPEGNFELKLAQGVDRSGNVFYRGRVASFGGDPATHAPIRRWNPTTDEVTDVVEIALPEVSVTRSGSAGNESVSMSPIPLAPEDEWAVGTDGRIAVARHTPFHLEWVDPDGTVTAGPEVAYDPVPIGGAEQQEWLERRSEAGGGISISISNNNGNVRTQFQRGGSSGSSRAERAEYDWPSHKPAFEGVVVASDGSAWVRRSRAAGDPPLYDIFDAEGRRTGSVEFEGRRNVISFTDESVYVISQDEFDLQTLERYRLPR